MQNELTSPIAVTLYQLRELILKKWIERVKAEIPTASAIGTPILVNTIPVFLTNLAEALDENLARSVATDFNNVAHEHGAERARITEYGPDEVIQEYLILRDVVIHLLEEKQFINVKSLATIQKSFDEAVRQAMMAFYLVYTELRENVVANLTHDMRTPLSAAKLTMDFILRKLAKPVNEVGILEIQNLIRRALKNIDYTNELIQNLLDEKYLKFVSQNKIKNFISAEMMTIVHSSINDLSDDIKKHVQVIGEPTNGFWDAKAIRRALENLVSNAVKYGAEDSPITITVKTMLGKIFISVHNEGNPIAAEQQTSLFNNFHRSDSARTSSTKGWGLGLAFCREVAEAHGGTLAIESAAETGTTFTIDVPVDARPMKNSPTTGNNL
jgi:signal transduction histidine kinase